MPIVSFMTALQYGRFFLRNKKSPGEINNRGFGDTEPVFMIECYLSILLFPIRA